MFCFFAILQGSHFSKLEKADILEMTVKYLRGIQRSQMGGQLGANPTTQAAKYRAGFTECANEVVRYVHAVQGVNGEVRSRLMGHLANCMQVVNSSPEAQPPRVPLQPLYVQVPNAGVPGGQDLPNPVSAMAAHQNMLMWSQQQQAQVHPMMAPIVTQGARSPPFVSPYSQGSSSSSRSSSPSSSIPSPSYSDRSSTTGTPPTRTTPKLDLHPAAEQEVPFRKHLEPQPSAMMPLADVKCKEENVWRPW